MLLSQDFRLPVIEDDEDSNEYVPTSYLGFHGHEKKTSEFFSPVMESTRILWLVSQIWKVRETVWDFENRQP